MKLFLLVFFLQTISSQVGEHTTPLSQEVLRTVAFYNLENLYDTIDDPETEDDERTPEGSDQWNRMRYLRKLKLLARTISQIGASRTGRPPHLLGVCEVENRTALEALIHSAPLDTIEYGIIHHDSPDERGIDVALVYDRTVFIPVEFKPHTLTIYNEANFRDRTRDQLVISGYLDRELIYIILNHWPSRSGGTARSAPFRAAAARLTSKILDSIRQVQEAPKILIMGDFNDNPIDASITKIIRAGPRPGSERDFYNPMYRMFQLGFGTLAYRDRWNLFDQIILSSNFLSPEPGSLMFWKAGIHNSRELVTTNGKYKGYPWRTYAGGRYTGGASDHFPVYIYLLGQPAD